MKSYFIYIILLFPLSLQVALGQRSLIPPCDGDLEVYGNPDLSQFLETVCTATAQFKKIDIALVRGYRPIGPETPHMGQHWINLRLMGRDTLNVKRPAVLTYSTVHGKQILTGVAYILNYTGALPAPPPIPGATWHYHTGSLEAELIGSTRHHHPHDMNRSENDAVGSGAAMFHAWLWYPNPDGLFEADNWFIPYLQTNWAMMVNPEASASKALSLMHSGADYYKDLIEYALRDCDPVPKNYIAILDSYKHIISLKLVDVSAFDAALQLELTQLWSKLWIDIKESLSPDQWDLVAPLAR